MKIIKTVLPRTAGFFLILSLLCGAAFPLAVTGISALCFREQAGGSIIEVDGVKYGSGLLGQQFTGENYLWGRVMNVDTATFTSGDGSPLMYAWPSNKSPASEEYSQMIGERVEKIRAAHREKAGQPIPEDLVTGSGSGLDPDISPAAASYQVERVARARGISAGEVQEVIDRYTTGRVLGLFGEPRVNVLKVNLALDGVLTDEE